MSVHITRREESVSSDSEGEVVQEEAKWRRERTPRMEDRIMW